MTFIFVFKDAATWNFFSFYRIYSLNRIYFFNMTFFRSWFRFFLQQAGKPKDNAFPDGFLLIEKRILRRSREKKVL